MDPDPQELLPRSLRRRWAVVPRDTAYQLLLVGAILGAGVGFSVAGLIVGSRPMLLGVPVALALAQLQNWLLPWERRATADLEAHATEVDADGEEKD